MDWDSFSTSEQNQNQTKTKLQKVGMLQSEGGDTMDGEPIEVVENFKYLEIGSLKSSDGNCNNDIRAIIGMAKQIMPNLHVQ